MNAKIEVNFDPSNEEQLLALNHFLSVVGGVQNISRESAPNIEIKMTDSEEEEETETDKKVKNSFKKKNEENAKKKAKLAKPHKENPKVEEVEEEAEEEEESEEQEEETVTIEEIRKLVSSKAKDHRKVIKDKLTELEADNVTSLDKEHYSDFYNFLMEL